MSISFSREGPAFPEQLVDALLAGEVVFLCGAGISAPQLPGFADLVKQCFEGLHVAMSPSEEGSFTVGRYEEALGSLSRRIVDPTEMTRAVVQLLQPPAAPDLNHHRTILRLSRDLQNRPAIVTTNFDALLEKALLELQPAQEVRALSFAGQDLPPPGSASFGGIIHLHGRIADPQVDLEETTLVITSADYGDAYMRSGWASRFLFDLCRCRTIVLVGYSAGDAPVRYFLNVLEADRQRFPDLRPVYALDAVVARDETDVRWAALAVEPIAYEYDEAPAGKGKGHSVLWRDLGRLGDLIERPRATRRAWAEELLTNPFANADAIARDRVDWLFRGKPDLWPVAIAAIKDAAWLDFFADRKLWRDEDAARLVAAWTSRDFQSVDGLNRAIGWLERFGKPFADAIALQLHQAKGLPLLWLRAWRLFSINPRPWKMDRDDRSHAVRQLLQAPVVFNSDLQKAVESLAPVLELNVSTNELFGRPAPAAFERLHDLIWPRLQVRNPDGAPSLIDVLVAVPQPNAIMGIATARLQAVIGLSLDIGIIDADYDGNDSSVPSVEPHAQNAHHDGPIFLVQLLARLLPIATEVNRSAVRGLVEVWRAMPGMLGIRLWLHALRNPLIFNADEAIAGLDTLPPESFWTVRRELVLVLRDRAAGADAELVSRVEQRILTEGEAYYSRFAIEPGQADWRSHARDAGVWLRLNMLDVAGRLSGVGASELAAIKGRREHLDRDVEDSDFFGSYSTEVRMVVGDAKQIIEASDGDRLEVARDVIRSPDIEKRHGWSAYCRTDPSGAFDTLFREPLDEANAPLWNELIASLSFPEGERDLTGRTLVTHIFSALEPANEPFLALVVSRLADLYRTAPRYAEPAIAAWWPRLFDTAVAHDTAPLTPMRDLYANAINSPGGRLTQAALIDIEQCWKSGESIKQELSDAIKKAAVANGRQGACARAVLVHAAGFLVTIKAQQVVELLDAALGQNTVEATALRSILVSDTGLSAAASRAFSAHILRGAIELSGKGRNARAAAAKIIAPALSIIRNEKDADYWGITVADTAHALRVGPPSLREGAAALLKELIRQIEGGPAEAWRTGIRPLLADVWPRERALREKGQIHHFADLAIRTGEAFPEALKSLLPYLGTVEAHSSTYAIEESEAPEKFPQATLSLLWRLFGGVSDSDSINISNILDRLIAALPAIELDRRLQWLHQRAAHYG